jgi:methionyl-tRNA synthetase
MVDTAAIQAILNMNPYLLMLILAWSLVWKGLALWKSARRKELAWFVILLVVNTLGILEILYIFLFSKLELDGKKKKKR